MMASGMPSFGTHSAGACSEYDAQQPDYEFLLLLLLLQFTS
jgi:hypothetical protein